MSSVQYSSPSSALVDMIFDLKAEKYKKPPSKSVTSLILMSCP